MRPGGPKTPKAPRIRLEDPDPPPPSLPFSPKDPDHAALAAFLNERGRATVQGLAKSLRGLEVFLLALDTQPIRVLESLDPAAIIPIAKPAKAGEKSSSPELAQDLTVGEWTATIDSLRAAIAEQFNPAAKARLARIVGPFGF